MGTGRGQVRASAARAALGSLTRREQSSIWTLAGAVVSLHVVGFGSLAVVMSRHFSLGRSGVFGVGLGLTAYTLGLRHAFDADHISAIDNTTRKFMAEGKRPLSVGFWFSLGHSTVVFALAAIFACGIRSFGGQITDLNSPLHTVAGMIGAGVSGGFLYIIAGLNVAILLGIVRVFREIRFGAYDEDGLEAELLARGLMNRGFGRLGRAIQQPWHMYPLGILFGLGFDTATEVVLLFLAAGAAGAGVPFYAILCLPILFAAGMSLLDTIDGLFMNFAYGWAFFRPVRKVFYNLVITGLSVAVAFIIGTIELGGVVARQLSARGAFSVWLENMNMSALGFVIVGVFAVTWIGAVLFWRLGRVEERWGAIVTDTEVA